jgi:hypothetical protein
MCVVSILTGIDEDPLSSDFTLDFTFHISKHLGFGSNYQLSIQYYCLLLCFVLHKLTQYSKLFRRSEDQEGGHFHWIFFMEERTVPQHH